jgi:hypothetical protein
MKECILISRRNISHIDEEKQKGRLNKIEKI